MRENARDPHLNRAGSTRLTTPLNPFNLARFTHSIQSSNGPTRRYDCIFPNPLLHTNLQSAQVFRSDLLNPLPPTLNTNDSATASDHLPVQIVFNHPFVQPFRIPSIVRSNQSVTLNDEIPCRALS